MHTGSCLCGAVKYRIDGDIGPSYYCHRRRCRKATGTAFASSALVAEADFVLTAGQEALRAYDAGNGVRRMFCGHCGSPIISRRAAGAPVRVRLGSLDTPLQRGPQAHIYVDSKAEWWDIHDDLPQHPEAPPPVGAG